MVNPPCERLLHSLSEYIDGTLDPSLCLMLQEHLSGCENCQIVYNTTLKTIDLYHASEEKEKMPGDVRTRLYMRLNLEDFLKQNTSGENSANG